MARAPARLALHGFLVLRCCLALRRVNPLERVGHPDWIAKISGPRVVPEGRHIQYLFYNLPHGLSDRMGQHFRYLVALGRYHNATVHLQGGADQAMNWLDRRHTHETGTNWDRYFDTQANGGNPWHPLENFHPCQNIFVGDDLRKLFRGKSSCANIYDAIADFRDVKRFLPPSNQDSLLPVSSHIKGAAHDFMVRYAVPESFGSIHIRRCDRGKPACTDPQTIYDAVHEHNHHSTWIVFLYAEPGYAEKLREKLQPLNRRFLFEGEVDFNRAFPLDNYFTYLLGRYLNTKAATIVETHLCKRGKPSMYRGAELSDGLFLSRGRDSEEGLGDFEGDEHLGAVCHNATRGGTLIKDPAKNTFPRGPIQGREFAHDPSNVTKFS